MPGLSSGLTPKIMNLNSDLSANTYIPVCKFDSVHTMTRAWFIIQTAMSTANSTTNLQFRVINGKTTGNVTTNITGLTIGGSGGGKWSAYTQRSIATQYTFSANHWAVIRYCETGTVAIGTWTASLWCVQGNL